MSVDQAVTLHHPAREELELPAVLHALSDPQRLQIVRELAGASEPQPCGTIQLDVAKSTMTHHFRVLRESGVIRQERAGTTKLTSLRQADLDARFPGLLDAVLGSAKVPAPVGA
ncbi:MAG TPA: helix-turn-helix transcriptional regulator [Solirubrobacterales bacterium]|jgi:DNA-binding transcriptional ArsR family regulator